MHKLRHLMLVVIPMCAMATPITGSGSAGPGLWSFQLNGGEQFSMTNSMPAGEFHPPVAVCALGDPYCFEFNQGIGADSMTLNGRVFTDVTGFLFWDSRYHFDSVPTGPVTVPFTGEGVFLLGPIGSKAVGEIVTGSGTLVFGSPHLVRTDPRVLFAFDTVTMSFTGQGEPVPEPASLGLVFGSLLAIAVRHGRRRRTSELGGSALTS